MARTFEFDLDMDKTRRSKTILAVRVGDIGSSVVKANIKADGEDYTPAGSKCYFECLTNAGTSVRTEASLSGSIVTATLPSQAFKKPGVISVAYFRFENGTYDNPSYVESTQNFAIVVPDSIDDNVDPSDYIADWRAVAEIEEQVNAVKNAAAKANASISEAASNVSTSESKFVEDLTAKQQQLNVKVESFDTNANQQIETFNTNGSQAISSFNSKADSAIASVNSQTETLKTQTDKAVQDSNNALNGTTASNINKRMDTLEQSIKDMDTSKIEYPIPVAKGGTGATDAMTARENLEAAASSHTHSTNDITKGLLPMSRGGTGAPNAAIALDNLGAAEKAHKHSANDITSGVFPIERGGTGCSTLEAAKVALGIKDSSNVLSVENGNVVKAEFESSGNIYKGLANVSFFKLTVPDLPSVPSEEDINGKSLFVKFDKPSTSVNDYIAIKVNNSTDRFFVGGVSPTSNNLTMFKWNSYVYGNSSVPMAFSVFSNYHTSSQWRDIAIIPGGYSSYTHGGSSASYAWAVSKGGTGATNATQARENLGITLANLGITSGTADPPATGTPGHIYIKVM
jgi:hypothetical protein